MRGFSGRDRSDRPCWGAPDLSLGPAMVRRSMSRLSAHQLRSCYTGRFQIRMGSVQLPRCRVLTTPFRASAEAACPSRSAG